MKHCKICRKRATHSKRLGPARSKGEKEIKDPETGKKKLPKCTGPIEYYCREHSGKPVKHELSGKAKKLGQSYPRKREEKE